MENVHTCPNCGFQFADNNTQNAPTPAVATSSAAATLIITHTPPTSAYDVVPPTPEVTSYPLQEGATIDLTNFKLQVVKVETESVALVITENQNVITADAPIGSGAVDYHKPSSALRAFYNRDYLLKTDDLNMPETWNIRATAAAPPTY